MTSFGSPPQHHSRSAAAACCCCPSFPPFILLRRHCPSSPSSSLSRIWISFLHSSFLDQYPRVSFSGCQDLPVVPLLFLSPHPPAAHLAPNTAAASAAHTHPPPGTRTPVPSGQDRTEESAEASARQGAGKCVIHQRQQEAFRARVGSGGEFRSSKSLIDLTLAGLPPYIPSAPSPAPTALLLGFPAPLLFPPSGPNNGGIQSAIAFIHLAPWLPWLSPLARGDSGRQDTGNIRPDEEPIRPIVVVRRRPPLPSLHRRVPAMTVAEAAWLL